MDTLIDLRTTQENRLVGRLEPATMRLHVRHRGEVCVFDLTEIVRSSCGTDSLVLVRAGQRMVEEANEAGSCE